MAVVWVDNFSFYATNDVDKFYAASGIYSVTATTPRFSNHKSLQLTYSGGTVRRVLAATTNQLVVGVAFRTPDLVSTYGFKIRLYDTTTTQLTATYNIDGRIQVWNGDPGFGTLLATSVNPYVTINAWHYMELKATISNTGSAQVQFNGVLVSFDGGFGTTITGDTQATANAYASSVGLYEGNTAGIRFTDFYIIDATVGTNTTFLGDCRVDHMYPTMDHAVEWTRSAGADNYANVDDAGDIDDDTTYNYSSTASQEDIFETENPPVLTSETVYAFAVAYVAKKDDAGTRIVQSLIHSTTEDTTYGTEHSLPGAGAEELNLGQGMIAGMRLSDQIPAGGAA